MMVCQYDESRSLVVLQTDHSRVAGLLAAHWGNERFAILDPYPAMVLAAQEHDNGWWDWEIKPTVDDQGNPLDYIGSTKHLGRVWLDFYREGIVRVARHDPYAGLMVLMHGVGLVTQRYGLQQGLFDYSENSLVQSFVRDHEEGRLKIVDDLRHSEFYRLAATDERIWVNYKLIEVFDQLAQFVCNRYPFNSTARRNGPTNTLSDVPVPVSAGEADATLKVEVLDETRAFVRPYPFDVDPLEISFPARLVSRRRYRSQEDFLQEYYGGERLTITYTLASAPRHE